LFPVSSAFGSDLASKAGVSAFVVGAPVFFASTAFAYLFAQRTNQPAALGWNLFGAVLGGLLEFSSMAVGLRNLILLTMALYLGAVWVHLRGKSLTTAP
jgi:hypothetical protein